MYDYDNSSESALIRRAKHGDVKAFSQLYSRIYKDMYRFALYMTRHPQDAEDAVSETVVAAYEHIGGLRKEESFRSWVFTILGNRCRQILKRGQREAALTSASERTEKLEDQNASQENDYVQRHDIRTAFESLDEEERVIIVYSVFGGYKSDEIARMMDKNAATVRSRKSRALEKMRVILQTAD